MTFLDFISRFPQRAKSGRMTMVRCPAHDDGRASLGIAEGDDGKILLKCFAGCSPEAICSSLGLTLKDLFPDAPKKIFTPKYKTLAKEVSTEKPVIEKTYSYTDAFGKELYQAVRMKPKAFWQRHRVNDKWVYNMDGVERVLYRLPEVLKADKVWIVEGEKDADNLAEQGHCATCNVGGAGKWLDGYTEVIAGKDVILCGDNDEPGQKHIDKVFESIATRAKSVKIIKLPQEYKDVSDFLFGKNGTAKIDLEELVNNAVPHFGGVKLPLYWMHEIEPKYKTLARSVTTMQFDLSSWLPSFRNIRPLIPGTMAMFVADTKVGKTAVLQNIAVKAVHLKTIYFQMELPEEDMYERFLAIKTGMSCREIEKAYRETDDEHGQIALMKTFPNFMICPETRLTPERIESIIKASELKFGEKPRLVLIDYVQLMDARGDSRYERASAIGEAIKQIAKATKTIIIIASQVSRPPITEKNWKPGLHSAKDSGSFENSSGLVIGLWRENEDPTLMKMKVLAATKGGAGLEVSCNFQGETMRITERANQQEPI